MLATVIAVAALLLYGRFITARAINVPYHDDIIDILGFLMRLDAIDSVRDKIQLMLEPYADHRTTLLRSIYVLVRAFSGDIDFRTLTYIGNLMIPAIAMFLASVVSRQWRVLALSLVVLFLCHPRGREFLFWPMSMLSFHGVVLFGLGCLVLLHRPGVMTFVLAICMATAATLSLASGQLVWLVSFVALISVARRGEATDRLRLLVWAALSCLALVLAQVDLAGRNPLFGLVSVAMNTPGHQLHYLLVLLGSGPAFGSIAAATGFGAAILCALIVMTPGELRGTRPVLIYFAWYLVLSSVAVALGRAPYSQLVHAIGPRYGVFSMSLVAVLLLLIVERFGLYRGRSAIALLLLGAIYCATSYSVWSAPTDRMLRERVAAYNRSSFWTFYFPVKTTNAIVSEAIRTGIYVPPPRPLKAYGDPTH